MRHHHAVLHPGLNLHQRAQHQHIFDLRAGDVHDLPANRQRAVRVDAVQRADDLEVLRPHRAGGVVIIVVVGVTNAVIGGIVVLIVIVVGVPHAIIFQRRFDLAGHPHALSGTGRMHLHAHPQRDAGLHFGAGEVHHDPVDLRGHQREGFQRAFQLDFVGLQARVGGVDFARHDAAIGQHDPFHLHQRVKRQRGLDLGGLRVYAQAVNGDGGALDHVDAPDDFNIGGGVGLRLGAGGHTHQQQEQRCYGKNSVQTILVTHGELPFYQQVVSSITTIPTGNCVKSFADFVVLWS